MIFLKPKWIAITAGLAVLVLLLAYFRPWQKRAGPLPPDQEMAIQDRESRIEELQKANEKALADLKHFKTEAQEAANRAIQAQFRASKAEGTIRELEARYKAIKASEDTKVVNEQAAILALKSMGWLK